MTTRLLIARHGETAWNRSRIFRGQYDVPLNDTGREQARWLGEALRDTPIDAAYSSPVSRALETGQIALQGRDISLRTLQGLSDLNFGDWTGLEEQRVAERWPDEYALWRRAPHCVQLPGGESLPAVQARAMAALEHIVADHPDQTVALFSHRVVTKMLVLGCLGLGADRFASLRQDNCCLNEIEHSASGYVIVRLNDTSHLHVSGLPLLVSDF
jgi:broad specificity phosphatase PhoE